MSDCYCGQCAMSEEENQYWEEKVRMSDRTPPSEMLEAINSCIRLDDEFDLDEWQQNFVISIEEQLSKSGSITEKQYAKLEEIYDKT